MLIYEYRHYDDETGSRRVCVLEPWYVCFLFLYTLLSLSTSTDITTTATITILPNDDRLDASAITHHCFKLQLTTMSG
jgi:hypothetical protein